MLVSFLTLLTYFIAQLRGHPLHATPHFGFWPTRERHWARCMWGEYSPPPTPPPHVDPPPPHPALVDQIEPVQPALFDFGGVFDERLRSSLSMDEVAVILMVLIPLLSVLQVLLVRLRDGCCDSTYAEDDGMAWSGELNEAPSDMYTEEQRRRDRAEEARIKGRASRSMSMSHV